MPTPEIHAKLSASSAHRWLHCPPSVKLAEKFPATTSSYAEAGRLAHSIAELKARKYFDPEPMSASTYSAQLKKLKADEYYEPRMDEATDSYLETLKALAMNFNDPPFVALETRVDFSKYVPQGFGTTDCIMIGGDSIYVIDYKNGAGEPVEAEKNPQMALYALGALQVYEPIFGDGIQNVTLVIVQPNAGGVKPWHTTVEALKLWATYEVAPTAALAWMGEGEFCAGSWCRFCPAKAQCSARAAKILELEPAMTEIDPMVISDAEIGSLLTRAKDLAAWAKDLEAYALSATLDGKEIPGWKAVEGRGSRDWKDQDSAFETLKTKGINEALLYERKPVSVASLEKSLGKKVFGETAEGLVVKNPGKPTLVPASDKRPPYNPAAAAFQVHVDG